MKLISLILMLITCGCMGGGSSNDTGGFYGSACIRGDVNSDMRIDQADVIKAGELLNWQNRGVEVPRYRYCRVDCDMDDDFDVQDVYCIEELVNGPE